MITKGGYVVSGVIIVLLSFAITLSLLQWWEHFSAEPQGDLASTAAQLRPPPLEAGPADMQPTALKDLPTWATPGISWAVVEGVNVQVVQGASAVAGEPMLQVTAAPTDGSHRLGVELRGLNLVLRYRVSAWVRSVAGHNLTMEMGDGAKIHAVAFYDIADQRLVAGTIMTGIRSGSADWTKLWMDQSTRTGRLIAVFYISEGGKTNFKGDGRQGFLLGGVSIQPVWTGYVIVAIALSQVLLLCGWFYAHRWWSVRSSARAWT